EATVASSATIVPGVEERDLSSLCRIDQSQQSAGIGIRRRGTQPRCCEAVLSGVAVSRNVNRRIQLARTIEMWDLVPGLARRPQPVGSDLPLNAEIPLLHIRHTRIGTECVVNAIRGVGNVLVEREWERDTAWKISIRVIEPAGRTHDQNFA